MRKRSTSGFTLLELLAVVAVSSMLMMVAMSLLGGLLDWSEAAESSTTRAASLDRMEQILRQQLRTARNVTADDRVLTVDAGDATATWTLEDNDCQLRVVAENEAPRVERFAIGGQRRWQLVEEPRWREVQIDAVDDRREMPFRVVAARPDQQEEPRP